MANNCVYSLLVVGEKENVNEFISMMDYTHPQGICFARIFEAYESLRKLLPDGRTAALIEGDCAWSVYSCMMEGYGTYYSDKEMRSGDPKLTTLTHESKRLGLDIEIFSEEPGIGFTEHYRIINGQILDYTCDDYSEYYYDSDEFPDFQDFIKEYGLPADLTIDDLDEGNCYCEGKQDWNFALL